MKIIDNIFRLLGYAPQSEVTDILNKSLQARQEAVRERLHYKEKSNQAEEERTKVLNVIMSALGDNSVKFDSRYSSSQKLELAVDYIRGMKSVYDEWRRGQDQKLWLQAIQTSPLSSVQIVKSDPEKDLLPP